MTEHNIQGHVVLMYDDPEDMPAKRWAKYNKYLLISGDLGCTIEELASMVQRVGSLVPEDPDTALSILNNMIQSMYLINGEGNPKMYALAALIHSIDGVEYKDLTESGLAKVVDKLGDWTVKQIDGTEEAVKKKIDEILCDRFPKLYRQSHRADEYLDMLVEQSQLKLESIIKGTDNSAAIRALTVKMAAFNKPKKFFGAESADIIYENNFTKNCQILKHRIGFDPETATVVEYLTGWDYLKEISKPRRGRKQAQYGNNEE